MGARIMGRGSGGGGGDLGNIRGLHLLSITKYNVLFTKRTIFLSRKVQPQMSS